MLLQNLLQLNSSKKFFLNILKEVDPYIHNTLLPLSAATECNTIIPNIDRKLNILHNVSVVREIIPL